MMGCRQAVRHQTLTLAFAGSNPASPAKYDSLAQLVEQRPFKAKVRGSSPRRVTKKQHRLLPVLFFHAVGREPRRGEIAPAGAFRGPTAENGFWGRGVPGGSPKSIRKLPTFLFIPVPLSAIITTEHRSGRLLMKNLKNTWLLRRKRMATIVEMGSAGDWYVGTVIMLLIFVVG